MGRSGAEWSGVGRSEAEWGGVRRSGLHFVSDKVHFVSDRVQLGKVDGVQIEEE